MIAYSQDKLFILALALLSFAFIYLLSPVLTPFLTGMMLAYLANPLVTRLMKLNLSRTLSVALVFTLLIALVVLIFLMLIPFLEKQLDALLNSIPDMILWTQTVAFPWLAQNFNIDTSFMDIDSVKSLIANNWSKAGGISAWILHSVFQSGAKALEWIGTLLLIPVVTFYFMCDWHLILSEARDLLPARVKPTITKLFRECDEVLSAFLRGQLLVMLVLSLFYGVGLTLMRVHMGFLIGMISGLLCIIPYLGFIVGIIAASITALVQFGSITAVAGVAAVFILGQTIDHFWLTPKLVGHSIGLHPIAVIFAILTGSCLFGFVGALLALPAAAVLLVWARYWLKT